ncbi:GNAT family N-acetyltransferase [Dyadobacter alkalitolerans]|uniref:GNAT family N-acetyltransferase n=1 Tax=Dyadobacter alkalitolerans TaxID=492736 RepID=UPI00047D4E53|nr:GNAT family N-acetyltransferase [Dyadobacter alkalitolerans]
MSYRITKLLNEHKKKNFVCGNAVLDNYIRLQAKQDVGRDLSACFVLVDEEQTIKGYYTLSASSISRDSLHETLIKNLPPSYQSLPTILLGRLACDLSIKGRGFGEILLVNALARSLEISETIGSMAVIVDPIDDQAQSFYKRYGFIRLSNNKMFIPTKTIRALNGIIRLGHR